MVAINDFKNILLNRLIIILFFCGFSFFGLSQKNIELVQGEVSFVTSTNVYVKFQNMEIVNISDTLFLEESQLMQAALVVTQKSSTSAVCIPISEIFPEKGVKVFFKNIKIETIDNPVMEKTDSPVDDIVEDKFVDDPQDIENLKNSKKIYQQKVRVRTSLASYSSLRQEYEDKHRLMYRLSINADHIQDSKLSFESYVNYRENISSGEPSPNVQTKFLRLYNAAIHYDIDTTLRLTLGRKINYRASSLGAIDGLQGEKQFGNYFVGAIAGFRPDFVQFDFNPSLFEYGVYSGHQVRNRKIYSSSTLGFLEQRNAGETDRRYMYVQHSSTFSRKLNLFASFELDLFEKINGVSSTQPRLTNFYISSRYRFSRAFNLTLSYDSRKRIIFYETLKTDLERLLEDDEARQGVRIRVNSNPIKFINLGLSYSLRFQSDDANTSNNFNAYSSISKIPGIGGRMSINFNHNTSNYLKGDIYSVRYSRPIIKRKLNLDVYYRNTNYTYLSSEISFVQNYYGANLNFRILKTLSFSVLGEMSTRDDQTNYRINTKLIKRFKW